MRVRPRFIYLLLGLLAGLPTALADTLPVGERIRFPNGAQYEVVAPPGAPAGIVPLGTGGFKTSYLVRDVSCATGCYMVVGIYHGTVRNHIPQERTELRQLLDDDIAPYVRRESPRVQARLRGEDTTISVSEYLPHRVTDFGRGRTGEASQLFRDPVGLRIVGEQLYDAIRSFNVHGLVHTDIKPENLLLAGHQQATLQRLERGDIHLVLADHDVLYRIGENAAVVGGTYAFHPPEALQMGVQVHPSVSLWQASMTLWELYSGTHLYRDPEFQRRTGLSPNQVGVVFLDPTSARTMRNYVMERMTARARQYRAEGWPELASNLEYVRDLILNGLQWNPAERSLNPQISVQLPEPVSRRQSRLGRVLNAMDQRMRAWRRVRGCPSLGGIMGQLQ